MKQTDALTYWKRYEVARKNEPNSLKRFHILDLPAPLQTAFLDKLEKMGIEPASQNVEVSTSPDERYTFLATYDKIPDFSERYLQFFRTVFRTTKIPRLDQKGMTDLRNKGLTIHRRTSIICVDRDSRKMWDVLQRVESLVENEEPINQFVMGDGFRELHISPRVLTETNRKIWGKGSTSKSVYSYNFYTTDDLTHWYHECGHLFADEKKGDEYREALQNARQRDRKLGSVLESANEEMMQEVDAWLTGLWLIEATNIDLQSFGDPEQITQNMLADITTRIKMMK